MAEEMKPGNTGIIRDKEGKFIEGISGNPAGKPLGTYSIVSALKRKLSEIVKENGKEAGDEYLELWLNKAKTEKGFEALKEIIHQIDGLPKQPIEMSGEIKTSNPQIEQLATEFLEQWKQKRTQNRKT